MNNTRRIIFFYLLLKLCTGEFEPTYLDGVQLNNISEFLCKDFEEIVYHQTIYVCSFVKFLNKSSPEEDGNNGIIFSYNAWHGVSFSLGYGKNSFVVDYDGETIFLKKVDFEKFMKICLHITNDSKVELEINYSKAKNKKEEEIISEQNLSGKREHFLDITRISFDSPPQMFPQPIISFSSFCIGDRAGLNSLPLELYGLEISNEKPDTNKTNDNLCIDGLNKESMLTFNSSEKWHSDLYDESRMPDPPDRNIYNSQEDIATMSEFNKTVIPVVEACHDTYVIFFTDYAKSFEDAEKMCKSLKGNLPSKNDVIFYRKHFIDINKNFKNQIKNDIIFGTWIAEDPVVDGSTLDSYCSYLNLISIFEGTNLSSNFGETNLEEHISKVSCIIEMQYNFCLIPTYSDFTYYGNLLKYDRNYFLKSRNNSLILEGENGTVIERDKNKWVLRSQFHKEHCELKSAQPPVGRHTWNCTTANQENFTSLLTFTHCKRNEFACTEGKCLSKSSRCNGKVDCSDKSDEENCQPIRKEIGYSTKQPPDSRKNGTAFGIQYFVSIANSDDITSAKGIATIDTFIGMLWRDPRIEFWNPVENEEISCDEIWHPKLLMTDEVYVGFRVEYDAYRLSCHVLSSLSEINPDRVYPYTDPYMGSYIKGEDMEISLLFSALVEVPCRFNLKKYPFGTQTCNLTFWPDNLLLINHKYEFFYKSLHNFTDYKIPYEGRKALGEFQFVKAFQEVIDKKYVKVTLLLKNLFGFHMLSSITPSFLICMIGYATFFFPIAAFNERIMVSLTSLLVLAALFTQSSNTSVITPYFKLLDIWYVALIFFCFMTVISNIMIHKVLTLEETRKKEMVLVEEKEKLNGRSETGIKYLGINNSSKVNSTMVIFFSILYALLLLFFSLSAAELI